jgi:hypothetical protein
MGIDSAGDRRTGSWPLQAGRQSASGLRGLLLLTIVVAAATAGTAAPKKPATSATFWSGRSGGFTWSFTGKDVRATGNGGSLSLRQVLFPTGDPAGTGHSESKVSPLSLVGSLISYRRDDYWDGGAHPSGWISYRTVDAARPKRELKRELKLTDLFPDRVVRDALWNDKIVRKALQSGGLKSPPATTRALVAALSDKTFGGDEGMTYGFSERFENGFSFHHLEGDQVAVRLCCAWGTEVYRFSSTEIGILLPAPPGLLAPLRLAAAGREGFLSREAKKRFKERASVLNEVHGSKE